MRARDPEIARAISVISDVMEAATTSNSKKANRSHGGARRGVGRPRKLARLRTSRIVRFTDDIYEQWLALKDGLHVKNSSDLAKALMEAYSMCTCRYNMHSVDNLTLMTGQGG